MNAVITETEFKALEASLAEVLGLAPGERALPFAALEDGTILVDPDSGPAVAIGLAELLPPGAREHKGPIRVDATRTERVRGETKRDAPKPGKQETPKGLR